MAEPSYQKPTKPFKPIAAIRYFARMKKPFLVLTLTLSILTLLSQSARSQTDEKGNPIFNSTLLETIEINKNSNIVSGYFTIANNIDDKESSVYVNDNPSLDEYIQFARDLPSYIFILQTGPEELLRIILKQLNDGQNTTLVYHIVNPRTKQKLKAPCSAWGEISEKRAEELLSLNIDPKAKIVPLMEGIRALEFNGKTYRIQCYEELKAEIIGMSSEMLVPTVVERDPEELLRNESIGGRFDFSIRLAQDEQQLYLVDDVAYNKDDFAMYLWGQAARQQGIENAKMAIEIWEEIHGQELTSSKAKVLKAGFIAEIE